MFGGRGLCVLKPYQIICHTLWLWAFVRLWGGGEPRFKVKYESFIRYLDQQCWEYIQHWSWDKERGVLEITWNRNWNQKPTNRYVCLLQSFLRLSVLLEILKSFTQLPNFPFAGSIWMHFQNCKHSHSQIYHWSQSAKYEQKLWNLNFHQGTFSAHVALAYSLGTFHLIWQRQNMKYCHKGWQSTKRKFWNMIRRDDNPASSCSALWWLHQNHSPRPQYARALRCHLHWHQSLFILLYEIQYFYLQSVWNSILH